MAKQGRSLSNQIIAASHETSTSSHCSACGGGGPEELNHSCGRRSGESCADLRELFGRERQFDRSVMLNAFIEPCHYSSRSACSMRDLCFKYHEDENEKIESTHHRMCPILPDYSKFAYVPLWCQKMEAGACSNISDCLFAHYK
jgi:hypothetical protein